MEILNTEQFQIHYQQGLEDFVDKSLNIFDNRKFLLRDLFGEECSQVDKLKVSLFTKREDFVNYIKEVSNGQTPPDWATGCFYNQEIQTLLNINNDKDVKYKIHTLTHETTHLYIQKLIYEKYKIDRIAWFDECYAGYVDGHIEKRTLKDLYDLSQLLKKWQNFDMNIVNDRNKVVTDDYNGYDMFMLIGKYIFDNNLQNEYIQILINNRDDMVEIGKTILDKSIQYIENLYKQDKEKNDEKYYINCR